MTQFDRELEERFVRYAVIDTQSDETSPTSPSTERQFDLLKLLEDELRDIGATDVRITEYGVVLATIPAMGQRSGHGRGHAGLSGSGGVGYESRQGWQSGLTAVRETAPVGPS
jgi:hypothetical protein